MRRVLAWARGGGWVLSLHRATQKLTLGEDVEFESVYVEPTVSVGHQMAIPGVGGMEPRASHHGVVAQGAQGVKEDKQGECVDKDERV